MDQTIRVAVGSIFVGLAVLALKGAAWRLTGSAALFSDAAETVVNVAASGIALYALRVASRPADVNHPFGHAKAEFVAAGLEGGLIVAAAGSILWSAWQGLLHPHRIEAPLTGVALNVAATLLNAGWAAVLLRVAARVRSPAMAADARHLLADVVTSVGVVCGVGLVLATGRLWLDPVVAAGTAVYVLWSGLRLIGASVGGLMDEAPSDGTVERICEVVVASGHGALEAHEVRTRQAGQLTFVQFHLVVPGSMRVDAAHEICDRIEAALRAEMPHLVVNIHVEPEHKAKHQDALVLT